AFLWGRLCLRRSESCSNGKRKPEDIEDHVWLCLAIPRAAETEEPVAFGGRAAETNRRACAEVDIALVAAAIDALTGFVVEVFAPVGGVVGVAGISAADPLEHVPRKVERADPGNAAG